MTSQRLPMVGMQRTLLVEGQQSLGACEKERLRSGWEGRGCLGFMRARMGAGGSGIPKYGELSSLKTPF